MRYVTIEPLKAGARSELIIKLVNPTPHQTTINLLKLCLEETTTGDTSIDESTEVLEKKVFILTSYSFL